MIQRHEKDFLTAEEKHHLKAANNIKGWFGVAVTWGMITGAMALALYFPNPLTIFLALLIIGNYSAPSKE